MRAFKRLRANKTMLAARSLRICAKKRNIDKVAKRAKEKINWLSNEQSTLHRKVKDLTIQLEQQQLYQESENRRYQSILERHIQSKKTWKKRAYAAEQARRYMLAKQLKNSGSWFTFKTKSNGAYITRIRSLSRKLMMSGVAAVQVPKVIRMCAYALGVKVGNIPSPRSIGRFVTEGGIGADIQVANVVAKADGKQTA